jgi:fructokinase
MDRWLSGPGLERDHLERTGQVLSALEIGQRAPHGDAACEASLQRYESRLARALAHVINLLDPDVIVPGGGLSRLQRLYTNVPQRLGAYVFNAGTVGAVSTPLRAALHGDSSGVRGAAWLWPAG